MKNKMLAVLLSVAVIAANVTPVQVFAASQAESVSAEDTEGAGQEEAPPGRGDDRAAGSRRAAGNDGRTKAVGKCW